MSHGVEIISYTNLQNVHLYGFLDPNTPTAKIISNNITDYISTAYQQSASEINQCGVNSKNEYVTISEKICKTNLDFA